MTLLTSFSRRAFLSWPIGACAALLCAATVPTLADPPALPVGIAAAVPAPAEDTDDTEEVILPAQAAPTTAPQANRTNQRAAPKSKIENQKSKIAPPRPPGRLTVRKFQHLRWSPEQGGFQSQGGVQVVYEDPQTNKPVLLTAQNVNYDPADRQVSAQGGVRLEREDGTLTGQEIKYNFESRAGYITNALAETDFFRMRGRRIETEPNGAYTVVDGVFTTCIRGRPDYQIHASRLTVAPNRYVSAKHITFYAGPTALVTIPSLRRNLRVSTPVPVPLPSYSISEGLVLRFQDTPIAKPHEALDLDLRVNFRRLPAGLIAYQTDLNQSSVSALPPRGLLPTLTDPLRGFLEQLTPPTYREYAENRYDEEFEPRATLFGVLQNKQFVFNRRRNDLVISRYPEVGVRFANLLGKPLPPPAPGQAAEAPLVGGTEGLLHRIPNSPFLLDITAALSEMHEDPTNVTAGRFGLRADAASQPLTLGRRLSWRLGLTDWLNFYSTGTVYNLFSPETELDYIPTRTALFSIGYRYLNDEGRTPFAFDRRDIRHELRFQYQVGGPWAFGVLTRYDLERSRAYDSEFAILRNFDCMQVGVTYRTRSQSFNIIFNLLPPTPNRARSRIMPIDTGQPISSTAATGE